MKICIITKSKIKCGCLWSSVNCAVIVNGRWGFKLSFMKIPSLCSSNPITSDAKHIVQSLPFLKLNFWNVKRKMLKERLIELELEPGSCDPEWEYLRIPNYNKEPSNVLNREQYIHSLTDDNDLTFCPWAPDIWPIQTPSPESHRNLAWESKQPCNLHGFSELSVQLAQWVASWESWESEFRTCPGLVQNLALFTTPMCSDELEILGSLCKCGWNGLSW